MDTSRRWDQLTTKQRLELYVNHTEWLLFQALLVGLVPNQNSIRAVIEAKRSLARGENTRDIGVSIVDAAEAFNLTGGYNKLRHKYFISPCSLAYTCYQVASDVGFLSGASTYNNGISLESSRERYLRPLGYMRTKSPLWKWTEENSILDGVSI